jgi:hypothetical protein
MNCGKSNGNRLVMKLPSTTTGLSSTVAPALEQKTLQSLILRSSRIEEQSGVDTGLKRLSREAFEPRGGVDPVRQRRGREQSAHENILPSGHLVLH